MGYYLGIDMGTSSIGWAVTDQRYNLVRRKGKDMWGVRLFPEAITSEDRRIHRTGRRRLQRERARIGMLRELLQPEIDKVDKGFYQRLQDSKFFIEDKNDNQPYALFNDELFTDCEYYKTYPTIFHLRKELIDSNEKHDIRLIYLALLNIFKHRGHFLNLSLGGNGIENIKEIFMDLNRLYEEYTNTDFFDIEKVEQVEGVLLSKQYSSTRKVEKICELCSVSKLKEKDKAEIIKMMCGLSGNLATAFPSETYDEESKKYKISLKSAEFEELLEKAENIIDASAYEIVLVLKRICDWSSIANIMSGKGVRYLSDARIISYEKHKADLQLLKKVYKVHSPELYDEMFRKMQVGNYSSYVGSVNSKLEYERRNNNQGKNRIDEFMTRVKKDVMAMEQDKDTQYILDEIDKKTFLPKQLTGDNGSIPYQLHKAELVKILENAAKHYSIFMEKDDSGLTVAEKIVALFEYNIPYFIGPLRNTQRGTGWSEVKGNGKITPWNIERRIDFQKSEEEFILRMIRHCTYLCDEYVLPKESLLYQKYCVLNELNNLKVNGEKISVDLKQAIYNTLFKRGKKVTGKAIKDYLVKNGMVDKDLEVELSGFDGDFVNTLSSYKKFTEVFKVDVLTYEQEKIAEDAIKMITIHSGSKKLIQEKLTQKYGEVLSKEQILRISGYRFTKWGNLSREFLQMVEVEGEITIIDRLWNTNCNLMEIMSSTYGYSEALNDKCDKLSKTLCEIEYDDLDDLYLSGPVKRMVWQTILLLKEIVQTMGEEPVKLFVETTRSNDTVKERTQSRKKRLEDLYAACKKEVPYLYEQIKNETDEKLRIKKLYLYYMQKGICMYTGEEIDIEDLMNDNLYDIDHIYPRHFRKDDSLENNLVLVRKNINNHKQDNFPLEEDIRGKMRSMWMGLYKGGFITKTKYERLTRNTGFSAEEKAEFIQRQLVETSQSTKAVAHLLDNIFENAQIVYVKASTVSQFRQQRDMLKVRVINNLHHAKDAYLNIVVGNVYNVKFTKNPMNFIKEYEKDPEANKYHMDRMFDYDVVRGGEVAWSTNGETSISIVKRVMRKETPLVTYMNFEAHGGVTKKDTIYGAKIAKTGVYMPISTKDKRLENVTKYGGRSDITGSYFFLVEHTDKKKRIRTIEPVYLHMVDKIKRKEDLEEYCRNKLGYIEPNVRLEKIKINSRIRVNGYDLLLTGRSGNQLMVANAVQLKVNYDNAIYLKKVNIAVKNKYTEEHIVAIQITKNSNKEIYDLLLEKHLHGYFCKKPNPIGEKLKKHRDEFIELSLLEQCEVLMEIVKATGKENNGANLTIFHEAATAGKINLNKKISSYEELLLINQSITGLYESRVNLLTV